MQLYIAVPATLLLVYRAYSRRSLTPIGILTAALTATIHALHPSPLPFTLLCVFFLLGTSATKVKHDIKATLTLSAAGASGGEGPRTSVQVLANSGAASALILVHLYFYGIALQSKTPCFSSHELISTVLLIGIVGNYAAVTADTLSSELGILSKSKPILITTLRTVPPGTNGGVSTAGVLAGLGGSAVIALTSTLMLPFRSDGIDSWDLQRKGILFLGISILGMLGSLLDSFLGAILQASVVDKRSGKIVEGPGGVRVMVTSHQGHEHIPAVHKRKASDGKSEKVPQVEGDSRAIVAGLDVLDNNQINFLMAAIISIGGVMLARVML